MSKRQIQMAWVYRQEVDLTPSGCHPALREAVLKILRNAREKIALEVEEYERLGLAPWDPKKDPDPVLPETICECNHPRRDHLALDGCESKCFWSRLAETCGDEGRGPCLRFVRKA